MAATDDIYTVLMTGADTAGTQIRADILLDLPLAFGAELDSMFHKNR